MKNRFKIFLIILVCILFAFIVMASTIIIYKNRTNITIMQNRDKQKTIKSEKIIYLDELGLKDIVLTGITYDSNNNSFWIVDHGKKNSVISEPKLIEVDTSFNSIKSIIQLSKLGADIDLQGISYSTKSDSLWIAAGNKIVNLSKTGKIKEKIETKKKYDCVSNGISYNENDGIDVLCQKKYLISFNKNGILIKRTKVNFRFQDQIYSQGKELFLTVGANYDSYNYVFVLNKNRKIDKIYRLEDSYAIEGIVIYDNKMYITNDGGYHSAKINKNYIAIYNIE